MADDFQTRTCSSSWWSSSRSLFTGSSSPCSTNLGEMSAFRWSSCQDAASANSGNHNIPIGVHGSQRAQASESVAYSNVLIDSEIPVSGFGLSSPTMDWNHYLVGSGRATSNYIRLQEDHLNTSQNLMQEGGATTQSLPSNSYSISSSSFGYPSPFLQGLFEPDSLLTHQSSLENQTAMRYNSSINSSNDQFQPSRAKILPQFLKVSPPKQQASNNQLHLSNSASSNFWSTMSDDNASLYSPPQCSQPQIFTNVLEEKPSCTNLSTVKSNGEEIRDSCSMTTKKATSSEGSFKRPRVETPSPLPTFKVRKEKLGDRITALQQLVSPFGKTDTASVLYEAIEYIKFLHDQVNVLSTPYMKHGSPMQQQQIVDHVVSSKDGDDGAKQCLFRRGLCLVPISSTFSVTNETTADFWTPTFGGTFR